MNLVKILMKTFLFNASLYTSFANIYQFQRVLILVSTTVDGLCAWKILQSLLHMDNVQYTLIPVDGKSHLESAFRTHSDQVIEFEYSSYFSKFFEIIHCL